MMAESTQPQPAPSAPVQGRNEAPESVSAQALAVKPGEGASGSLGGEFNSDQVKQMGHWLIDSGSHTPEQVNAMLAESGVEGSFGRDTRSETAKAIDAVFPQAKPHEYDIPPISGPDAPFNKETFAQEMQFRGWLHQARFTREHGSSLANECARVASQHAGMTPGERELFKRKQAVELQRLFGNRFEERVSLASQLVFELDAKNPGLVDYLEQTGVGNSALVVSLIAAQAERLKARL